MKRLFLILGLLAACGGPSSSTLAPKQVDTPVAPAAPSSPSAVKDGSFHSESLGVDKAYVVYLPAGYESSTEAFPVIYMLHGLGGSEINWRELGIAAAADALALGAIIVMPDGDDGFYSNWVSQVDYDACLASRRPFGKADDMRTYCVRTANYEDYIVQDLIAHVDGTYRTIATREGRAIGGLSMGGYGATFLSMKHPALFSAVASHAGAVSLLYAGPHPYAKGAAVLGEDPREWISQAGDFGKLFERIWGTDIATWRANDPTTLARALKPGQLALYLDCGTEDEFKLEDANQYLDEVLTAAGIPHTFHLIEGGRHNSAFWRSRIDDSLGFLQQHLPKVRARAQLAAPAIARTLTVGPGEIVELNLKMPADATARATFTASAPLEWNTHSHPDGKLLTFTQGTDATGELSLSAQVADVYSMMWKNAGATPATLELRVAVSPGVTVDSWHPAPSGEK